MKNFFLYHVLSSVISRFLVITAVFFFMLSVASTARSDATCGSVTEAFAEVSMEYTPKFLSSKPQDDDVAALQDMAIKAAWEEYIGFCMDDGRLKQYLAKKDQILADITNYVSVVGFDYENNKSEKNVLDGKVVIRVKTKLIDALFADQAGSSVGEGALMMWIFSARQTSYIKDGTTIIYDPTVDQRSQSKNLNSMENTYSSDGTTTVESTVTETMTQNKSSGTTVLEGAERELGERNYIVVSSADFSTSTSSVLTLNNFEPVRYVDVVNECGGVEPDLVEEEIALNGKMSRETRKSVINAARDCEIEFLAIGTIDIGLPEYATSEGYRVSASVNGIVIDIRKRLPRDIAAFGPIQANDGGIDDVTAIRNALINSGEKTAKEIVAVLDAKGIR